jgi:hypothetical protein
MNAWRSILRSCGPSLLTLGVSLACSLVAVSGARIWSERSHAELRELQHRLAAQQAVLSERKTEELNRPSQLDQFRRLIQRGLVGKPERESWVEQWDRCQQRIGPVQSASYTLHPPRSLAPQLAGSAAASAGEALFHDLEFELQGVQDEEFLALLQDYSSQVNGRFRVNACQLSQPTAAGLRAQCVLRFFTLTPAHPRSAPAPD